MITADLRLLKLLYRDALKPMLLFRSSGRFFEFAAGVHFIELGGVGTLNLTHQLPIDLVGTPFLTNYQSS